MCSNWSKDVPRFQQNPSSTCDKAAWKIDGKGTSWFCLHAVSPPLLGQAYLKIKLWHDESDSDSANFDTSEQSSFLDKHDVGNDGDKDERNYSEDVQFEDVKSGMWVLVFYEQENWLGNVLEKWEGQVRVKCFYKPFGVNMLQKWKERMKPFITIKSTKKMFCCVNLVVAPVKTFSGKTDLHKILISEAFTVMFLTKNYCWNH